MGSVFYEYPDTIYDLHRLTYGHVCSRWPCLFKVATQTLHLIQVYQLVACPESILIDCVTNGSGWRVARLGNTKPGTEMQVYMQSSIATNTKEEIQKRNRETKQKTSTGRQAGKQVVASGKKRDKQRGKGDLFIYKFHRYATMQ